MVFPLCSKCATENIKACLHSDADRELENTWVLLEVMQAIKLGYKVTKIFKKVKYHVHAKEGGLFTDYVNTFLKIKQEASGFPNWVLNETDQNQYINDYYKNEGILLEKNKIVFNPGLKALSKLLLNSQWGRYAMNTHKTKCKFIKKPSRII